MLPNLPFRLALTLLATSWTASAAPTTGIYHPDPQRFTYTPMLTPLSTPCDVAEGPDGLVYIQLLTADKIVRYNQHTNTLTEFPIPFTTPILPNVTLPLPDGAKAAFLACAFRNGFDGKMYFSNGLRNQLVQFDPSTEEIAVFTPPGLAGRVGNLQPLNDITAAEDGVYFTQTTGNAITHFSYATHQFTNYLIPTLLSAPLGIYHAADGGVWFLEFVANKVGRLDRDTGSIEEYALPGGAQGPIVVRAETRDGDGDMLLWFAVALPGGLGSINQRTREVKLYPETGLGVFPSLAVEVAQDYADNIWVTHLVQNTLGVYNPGEGRFTEVVLPGTLVEGIVGVPTYVGTGVYCKPVGAYLGEGVGGIGNAVWFTEANANRLVRFDIEGLEF